MFLVAISFFFPFLHSTFGVEFFKILSSIIGVNFFRKATIRFILVLFSPCCNFFCIFFSFSSLVLSGSTRTENWDRHRVGKWRSGFLFSFYECKVRIDETIFYPHTFTLPQEPKLHNPVNTCISLDDILHPCI